MAKNPNSEVSKRYWRIVQTAPPITVWYNGHGVVPIRQIVYRHVSAIRGLPHATIGKIQYKTRTIYVTRRALPTGDYTRWESIGNINLIYA